MSEPTTTEPTPMSRLAADREEWHRLVADRLTRLQAVTAALAAAQTSAEVGEAVFRHGLEAMQASGAALSYAVEPGRLQVLHETGFGEKTIQDYGSFSPDDPVPAADAFRTGEAVWLGSPEIIRSRYPHCEEYRVAQGSQAWAALPLVVTGRKIGTLGLTFASPMSFDPDEQRFIGALAEQCAVALERTRAALALAESEARYRAAAEKLAKVFQGNAAAMTFTRLRDGLILDVNEQYLQATGWARDELVGKSMPALGVWKRPEDRERFVRALQQHGVVRNEELSFTTRGGVEWTGLVSAQVVTVDGEPCVVSSFVDITERKRVEEALARQRELLQGVFDNIPVLLVLWEPRLRRFTLNRQAEAVLGWSTEEANRGGLMSLVYPDPAYRAEVSAFMQSLAPGFRELSCRTKDGQQVPIEWANIRLVDETSIGIGVDVRERKRAEQAVRRSEMRYRNLHESMRDAFVQVSMDGRIIEFNEPYCQMLGYSPAEMHTLTYQQLTPERWHAFEERIVREQIIGRGYSDVYEKEYRRKDGTIFPVELRTILSRDETGQPSSMWGIVRDTTERKRAEAALRRSQEEYRHLVEGSGSVILRADKDLRITFMNQHGLEFFGYSAEELIGRSALQTIIPEKDAEGRDIAGMARDLMRHPEKYPTNVHQNRRKDGRLVWMSWANKPIHDGEGNLVELLVVGNDISALKQMEEERERYLAQIEEANEAKDLFFNTLSHELRTPLAAMLNAAELLKNPELRGSHQARALGILERNIRQQAALIEDLLDLSRIVRKKVEIEREPLDLRAVVSAEAEAVEPAACKAQLQLQVELPDGPVPVLGDAARLGQVVSNLLNNAVKFTEPGGTIAVKVAAAGEEATVRVRDTGIGISADLLPRMFEPFRQAETSLARSKGGLGIGLAVARSLAELHGGRLDAQSTPGKGSEFTLRLALRSGPPSSRAAAPAARGGTRPRRVLIVEDNPDLRESLAMLLEMLGHVVLVAADGGTGVELARRERPDIALVDIGLPDMDGYAVARVLSAEPVLGKTRLIALSGYATPEHRDRALASGFHQHLAKPVEVAELERVLGEVRLTGAPGSQRETS